MKKVIALYILFVIAACNSNNQSGSTSIVDSAKSLKTSNNNQAINEQPAKTIIDFLVWYRNHTNQLNEIGLVNNNGDEDTTKFYSVNFKGTENYLKLLKSSGYISDKYIETWRQYFNNCEKRFKLSPESEGPPDGFDYDFVMNGQDYEDELLNAEKATVIEIVGSDVAKTVKLKLSKYMTLTYDLSLINGKWCIDRIY